MMEQESTDRLFKFDRKTPVRVVGGASLLTVAFVLFAILWPLRWNLVALWVAIEALFYTFYWRPRYAELNKQPVPHRPSRHDAMKAFRRCIKYFAETPDLDTQMYYSGWFLGAKFEDIKRENCEEFLAYAFWYRTMEEMEAEGLNHFPAQMVDELEKVWNLKLVPGHNPSLRFMGHLWEPLKASWRPLAFYIGTETIGWFARQLLQRWGFEQHTHQGMPYFTLNMGNLGKACPTSRACSAASALSDATVDTAMDNIPTTAAVSSVTKPAKSPPPVVPVFASAAGSAAAAAVASNVASTKSSPFVAAKIDWAAQLKAQEESLAASITAASAVHGASVPIAAAVAPAVKPSSGGGWRSRLSGHKQPAATNTAQPLPYLNTHTSVMLKNMGNPLEDALESGFGSKDMPVLFLHGVGGLPAYLEMMLQVMALGHPLIVVECSTVAMRLGPVSDADKIVGAVVGILDKLGVEEACVIGHSYGTFIAGRLARLHRTRVHSLCLIDPVCFGMFMPQLLSNFLYNKPQWKGLHHIVDFVKKTGVYVASHELHVCCTFSRGFFWTDLNLWPEDMAPGSVVLLSGRDDLMNARQVQAMLERAGHIKVHYNSDLTHGEFLIKSEVKQAIMDELRTMLARSGSAVVGLARPVLQTTITLARNALGATKVRLHTTKNGTRYVEDHTNKLVRTFTGNLTAVLSSMNTNRADSPRSAQYAGGSGSPFLRSRFGPSNRTSKTVGGTMASVAESASDAADASAANPGRAATTGGAAVGLSQAYSLPVKQRPSKERWAKKVLNGATGAEAAFSNSTKDGESDSRRQEVFAKHSVAAAVRTAAAMSGFPMPTAKHRLSLSRKVSKDSGSRRSSGAGGVQFGGVEVIPGESIPEGSEESS